MRAIYIASQYSAGPRNVALVLLFSLSSAIAANVSLTREAKVSYDFANIRVPVWSGGALAAFSSNRTSSPVLITFDDQGRQMQAIAFTIPGADMIDLYDVARSADGALATCGKAFDRDGRGSGFFAVITGDIATATVVRLYAYYPSRVTIASDGTIWTTGLEAINGKETGPGVDPSHGVLRHFDRTGKQIGSFIPRSSLASPSVAMYGFLRSANGRVGWYTGPVSGPGSAYYEVLADGTLRRFPTLALNQMEFVTGLGLTDDGSAYVTTSDNKNGRWRLLSTDSASNRWTQHKMPAGFERATLYGADGSRLAFFAHSASTVSFAEVSR